MFLCACVYGVKREISLDTGDSASNAVVKRSVFINQRCAECVCLYTIDFVSTGKNALLLYVTVCEKVMPRLDKYDDVIEWNFMKIAFPEMKSWLRPCLATYRAFGTKDALICIRNKNLMLKWTNWHLLRTAHICRLRIAHYTGCPRSRSTCRFYENTFK